MKRRVPEVIKKTEVKEYRSLLILGVALILLGFVLAGLFFRRSVLLSVIGLGCLISGVKLVYDKLPPYRQGRLPVSHLLQHNPRQIVWVYSIVTQRMPFGFEINQSGIMYFKCLDKTTYSLALPSAELRSTAEQLNELLPHATFGYTEEREQWYLAHPGMLYKESQEG